jgi:hypothetical protein
MRALKAGARGYILKRRVHKELLETIRAVHAGQKRLPPEVAAVVAEHVGEDELSAGELDVLRLIAAGNANNGDCWTAFYNRGNGQKPRYEHPLQAGGQRPHSRRNDRTQARDSRNLARSRSPESGSAGLQYRTFRFCSASRTLKAELCNESSLPSRTDGRVAVFSYNGCSPEERSFILAWPARLRIQFALHSCRRVSERSRALC